MKKIHVILIGFICIGTLASCDVFKQTTPTPTAQPTPTIFIIQTEIPLPTPAETTPLPTSAPAKIATQSAVTMISAEVTMDSYSLRVGPGRLFERVYMYNTGEIVNILGRETSNNWVLVQTSDNRAGWMNVTGLDYLGELDSVPVFTVSDVQVLHGHVYLADSTPATGIGVSLAPSSTNLSDSYDESITNTQGEWYIYMPLDIVSGWWVGPNSAVCGISNAVTANEDNSCTINGNLPPARDVSLPLEQDVAIEFQILPLGD